MSDGFAPSPGWVIQPDGSLLFDFDGHVHARGVDLDAGDTTSPPEDRRVRWLRTSDGAIVADINSYEAGGGRSLVMEVLSPTGTTPAATMRTVSTTNGFQVGVQASQIAPAGGMVVAYTDSSQAVVVDEAQQSSFLQLVGGLARRRVNFGQGSLTWTASPDSATTAVNHQLGVAPVAISILSLVAPSFAQIPVFNVAGAVSNTQFPINARFPDLVSRSVTQSFMWIAIG